MIILGFEFYGSGVIQMLANFLFFFFSFFFYRSIETFNLDTMDQI